VKEERMRRKFTIGLLIFFVISYIGLTLYFDKQSNNNYDNLNQVSENVIHKTDTEKKDAEEIDKLEITSEEKNNKIREHEGFVLLKDIDKSFIFDIRYATNNNFTHKVIYPTDICVLRTKTAYKLVKANEILKSQGYKIKIFDGYRPISVQKIFWDLVQDSNYVANPSTGGSIHNKGCAVDITLVDINDNEVEMPSEFDDFSEKAFRSSQMSNEARKNLEILTNSMVSVGFQSIDSEWWHYEDNERSAYSVVDLDLTIFN
jgi:D-alanyl-D-alanine dipeptidase